VTSYKYRLDEVLKYGMQIWRGRLWFHGVLIEDFTMFSESAALQEIHRRYRKHKGGSMNVVSITHKPKRRSDSFQGSIERLRMAKANAGRTRNPKLDLMKNINYWKEHGKLPANTDMAKVMGKGRDTGRRIR